MSNNIDDCIYLVMCIYAEVFNYMLSFITIHNASINILNRWVSCLNSSGGGYLVIYLYFTIYI